METKTSRVRIVPMFKPDEELVQSDIEKAAENPDIYSGSSHAPPKNAHLIYGGGPLIENVEVYAVFWGENWTEMTEMKTLLSEITKFFKDILVSPLMDQLGEYSVPGKYTIGRGEFTGHKVITASAPITGSAIDDAVIRTNLLEWIKAGKVPARNPNILYFIYLDKGVVVTAEGDSSCAKFCGYHDAIDKSIFYAVMPYPNCYGCLGGRTVKDAVTATSSHELCEAITDPVSPSGWYDTPNDMEIGDLCAWHFKKVNVYNVQVEWSNEKNKCV